MVTMPTEANVSDAEAVSRKEDRRTVDHALGPCKVGVIFVGLQRRPVDHTQRGYRLFERKALQGFSSPEYIDQCRIVFRLAHCSRPMIWDVEKVRERPWPTAEVAQGHHHVVDAEVRSQAIKGIIPSVL